MPFVVFLTIAPTFSSVTPVTGSQMLFAVFGGLLRFQVIRSSALSLFSLPFPTPFRIFLSFSSLWRPASNRILVEVLGVRKENSSLVMWYKSIGLVFYLTHCVCGIYWCMVLVGF